MTSNKGAIAFPAASSQPSPALAQECCMCGDCGLSYELFQCKVCQYRSQHRYCSNLYPKAESYHVCNWCLSDDTRDQKSQNSSNSSSSNKKNSEDDGKISMIIKTKNSKKINSNNGTDHDQGGLIVKSQRVSLQNSQIGSPIKKQKSPERSTSSTRRRLMSNARLEDKLIRRTKSEEISNNNNNNNNGIITKHVFRNKVRRYKLLDEVSS